MRIKIKNCGLKTPESIDVAVRSGASFIGFVHHSYSPRHLTLTDIARLMALVPPPTKRVIVLADPDDALLDTIGNCPQPEFLQIHGVTDPARLQDISRSTGIPLITAINVTSTEDIALGKKLEPISAHILFDAPSAGSGMRFDWKMFHTTLQEKSLQRPWFLAGGLNIHNVAEAIQITHAPMVDVSSGIESQRGVKSAEMIAAFNGAVANHAKI